RRRGWSSRRRDDLTPCPPLRSGEGERRVGSTMRRGEWRLPAAPCVATEYQPFVKELKRAQDHSIETVSVQWYIACANTPLVPSGARREAAPMRPASAFSGRYPWTRSSTWMGSTSTTERSRALR